MGILLTTQELCYRIGETLILDHVGVHISENERFGIVGPNGAGKSTLLKSFMRIIPKSDGDIILNGKVLERYKQKELARWLAYVPQFAFQDLSFSVTDFMLMGRYPHLNPFSLITHDDREAVEEALEMVDMTDFRDRTVQSLSGGEQQKIMVGAALVQGARILLLDEPAAFLDPRQQDLVYELLERLHKDFNITMVEVTHDINRAALNHDRIVGLKKGSVVFDGTPEELMEEENLYKIYGKRFKLIKHPEENRKMVLPEVTYEV